MIRQVNRIPRNKLPEIKRKVHTKKLNEPGMCETGTGRKVAQIHDSYMMMMMMMMMILAIYGQ